MQEVRGSFRWAAGGAIDHVAIGEWWKREGVSPSWAPFLVMDSGVILSCEPDRNSVTMALDYLAGRKVEGNVYCAIGAEDDVLLVDCRPVAGHIV